MTRSRSDCATNMLADGPDYTLTVSGIGSWFG